MEAVRAVVDRLQSFAPQPPRGLALGGGLRPGAGAAGRGAAVPTAAQPLPRLHRPQGHQLQAADVPGRKGGGGRGSVGLFVVLAQKFVARVDGAGLCRCLHRLLGSRTAGLNRCGGTTGTGWGGIRPRERRKLLPRIYIIRKQKQLSVLRAA